MLKSEQRNGKVDVVKSLCFVDLVNHEPFHLGFKLVDELQMFMQHFEKPLKRVNGIES